MSGQPSPFHDAYRAFSADGHRAAWSHVATSSSENLTLSWENEAWTASGIVEHANVHYVLRISATWHVSQFLLFRDLEDPDLWLGTDGHGRWGEMNGDHRIDLDGCVDLDLDCTPFTSILPIRRNSLHVGDSVELAVVAVDVEKLDLQPGRRRYTRLEPRRWQVDFLDTGTTQLFEVDEFGLPLDHPDGFCRLS